MKQTCMHGVAITLMLLFFVTNLNAQCPTCDQALEKDTRDYYQNELHSSFNSMMDEIYSHEFSYYYSGDWKSNTNFQSGGSYGIISGFLNGSQTKDQ